VWCCGTWRTYPPASLFTLAASRGRVVVVSAPGCGGYAGLERLSVVDPDTGVLTEITGTPSDDDGRYVGGPVSWLSGR